MSQQPLSGIRVLDFSTLLPGPMASLMLAEAGAEVIKVERPRTGEELRHYQPRWGREAVAFSVLNRGKKSITVDLKDLSARKRLVPLIRGADIVLEQFRPGVMERLGLGYETLKVLNSRIIYCSITGYGATGAKASVAGHDLNYIGDTGVLSLSMGSQQQPVIPPVLIADLAGGTYPAVVNILLALLGREKTGQGTHLDIAMTDNVFMLTYWASAAGNLNGDWPKNGGELLTGGSPRYQLYPTNDDKFVAVAALEDKFWQTFCQLIGYRDDSSSAQETILEVAAIIATQTAQHWRNLFTGQDCCCSVVASLEQAMDDPHFKSRGLFDYRLSNEQGDELPALPMAVAPQFRGDVDAAKSAPALGADNDEFLKG